MGELALSHSRSWPRLLFQVVSALRKEHEEAVRCMEASQRERLEAGQAEFAARPKQVAEEQHAEEQALLRRMSEAFNATKLRAQAQYEEDARSQEQAKAAEARKGVESRFAAEMSKVETKFTALLQEREAGFIQKLKALKAEKEVQVL